MPGNSHGQESVLWLVDDVKTKLNNPLMIIRLDNGYLKGEILNEFLKRQLQLCMACRYDWVQGVSLDESKWEQIDDMTKVYKVYDVEQTRVVSTCDHLFRVVLVEKRQVPFPNSKSKKHIHRYGILERLV